MAENFNAFLEGLASENEDHFGETTLVEMIAEGESNDLEFKQSLRWGSSEPAEFKKAQSIIMKTIAGFANAEGGSLLMGVTDDGVPVGLEPDFASLNGDKDEYELYLGQLIDNEFGKAFRASNVSVSFPVVSDVMICRVDVMKSQSPTILSVPNKHGQKLEKYYVRSGNSTQELNMAEASEHIRQNFVAN